MNIVCDVQGILAVDDGNYRIHCSHEQKCIFSAHIESELLRRARDVQCQGHREDFSSFEKFEFEA